MLGTISKAAEKNLVSQSAISQAIAKLEASFGVALTTHGAALKLTEEGHIVFQGARDVFQALSRLDEELQANNEHLKGFLAIAVPNSIATALLPDVLLAFEAACPQIKLSFHRGSRASIKSMLDSRKVDCALVMKSAYFAEYRQRTLYQGRFGVYGQAPLAGIPPAGVMVDHRDNREVERLAELYSQATHEPLVVHRELSSWSLVHEFAKRGAGCGLLPDFMVRDRSLVEISLPFAEELPYDIAAVWPQDETMLKSMQALFKVFTAVMSARV